MIKAKIDYKKQIPNDEFYTPSIAVEMILPYIPERITRVWECTAVKSSMIVSVLRNEGYTVIATHVVDGYDFFDFEPSDYDIIITNPPYSTKDKFLQRAFSLGKPFMFLLPIDALGGQGRIKMYRKNRIQLLIPDRRIEFNPQNSHGAWFHTAWFTYGLNLEKDLNYIFLRDLLYGIGNVHIAA